MSDQILGEVPDADEVLDALDALVDAVHMTAGQLDLLVRRVDVVHGQRERGATYAEILGSGGPLVPEVVTDMLTELLDATSVLRRTEAKALYAEGLSMDGIARLFQVSRQRVSALLRSQIYRSRR